MFKIFEKFPFLVAEVSEKKDGNMKISGDKEKDKASLENRRKFFEKLGIKESEAVNPLLSHSSKVLFVEKNEAGKYIKGFDGLISKEERVFLSITIADCLPVFFFEEKSGLFGLVHAGWRGIYGNILESTISLMRENGADSENILAGIGPGISLCHFEISPVRGRAPLGARTAAFGRLASNGVRKDLFSNFKNYLQYPGVLKITDGRSFLNLKEIAKLKLREAGLPEKNIEINSDCTFCCGKKYFSFRREGRDDLKTMVAVIGKN